MEWLRMAVGSLVGETQGVSHGARRTHQCCWTGASESRGDL